MAVSFLSAPLRNSAFPPVSVLPRVQHQPRTRSFPGASSRPPLGKRRPISFSRQVSQEASHLPLLKEMEIHSHFIFAELSHNLVKCNRRGRLSAAPAGAPAHKSHPTWTQALPPRPTGKRQAGGRRLVSHLPGRPSHAPPFIPCPQMSEYVPVPAVGLSGSFPV